MFDIASESKINFLLIFLYQGKFVTYNEITGIYSTKYRLISFFNLNLTAKLGSQCKHHVTQPPKAVILLFMIQTADKLSFMSTIRIKDY